MRKHLFLVSKILITGISFIGIIIFSNNSADSNLSNNLVNINIVQNALYDVSIGIFSAMILVWFIDEIGNHIKEHQSQKKEILLIKRCDKVLKKYIEQYITMFYCVATPLEKRNFKEVGMPETFTLNDMCDLHQTSLLVKEGFMNSAVDSFLSIELGLRKEFASLIQKYDFDFYPQFAEIFLDYIQTSVKNDCRAGIASNREQICRNEKYAGEIHDLLKTKGEDYYNRALSEEKFSATIIHPYMYLYEMMKVQRKLILNYQAEIIKIEEMDDLTKRKFIFAKVWARIKKGTK
ncbi:MAG: hypothetical protein Q4F78_06490 [Bacillota bacterium]|nr:hypothetical protein [Bacillota bacterium]